MKKNKHGKFSIITSISLIFLVLSFTSCSKIEELEKNMANSIIQKRMGNGETRAGNEPKESPLSQYRPYDDETEVKAANRDYIILQEITDEEKVEETSAEHPYQNYTFPYIKNINIGEYKFLTQINTIRKNIEKYTESVVTLEGMYGTYISHDNSMTHPIVYRNGPGCCGNDDYDGFLLINVENAYQGATPLRLNDWIKVVGTPFMHEHTNNVGEKEEYLFLIATSIEKLDLKSRGAEMVND